ncbi:hypothetical protein G6F50_018124 [Rhizopus delemar]|uniref:Uncharacterized protein n=1 Tax=Rhizopus delemar TaxID=936053 RepID=A0A9P6XNK7_9FUNG|nr:hypothetical protein G6F50_018124 [Rhizopus delemar]
MQACSFCECVGTEAKVAGSIQSVVMIGMSASKFAKKERRRLLSLAVVGDEAAASERGPAFRAVDLAHGLAAAWAEVDVRAGDAVHHALPDFLVVLAILIA